ncbi:MAG TPA: hypothetical protein VLB02_02055, partial [Candidatus Paceibacterota bacterium]|nr:hypothetical protein [Candidatus Paceibacterota bacterium]
IATAFVLFSCNQKNETEKKTSVTIDTVSKATLAKRLPTRTAGEMLMDSIYKNVVDSVNTFIDTYGDGRGLGDAWWDSKIPNDQPFNRIRLCKTIGDALIIERRIFPFNNKGEVLGYMIDKEYFSDSTYRYFVESSRYMKNEEVKKDRKTEQITTPEEMALATEVYRTRLKQAYDNLAILNGKQEKQKTIQTLSKNG